MGQSIIVYDLETTSQDVGEAIPRIMGFHSSKVDGFRWTTDINEMISILNDHDVIVGYNHKEYDNKILEKYGACLYYKVNIDVMEILHGKGFGNDKGRKGIITTPDKKHLADVLHKKSLAAATIALGGPHKIGDFDYNLFKKEFRELNADEQKLCLEYLEADIDATAFLYKYIEDFFHDFREGGVEIAGKFKPFMNFEQKRKKQYLTASTASWTYKVLCNLAGIEERYSDAESKPFGGGFVALPSVENCRGKIYCLDYNSLYPHIMIQCNLYGKTHAGWKGDGISTTVGTYDDTKLAPVGNVLKELYQKRLKYKSEKDAREYTIKIIINTIYGLLGNSSFASVCDYTAAEDCTKIGQQWVIRAREFFISLGYNVLYTDTDSVYLEDVYCDEARLIKAKDEHIAEIKASVPFPQDTFDMGIDDRIKFMAFSKSRQGALLKKNYLYITEDDKLKIKGMQIIKSNCTELAKTVFNNHIKPGLMKDFVYQHPGSKLEEWMEMELKKDVTLASIHYKVKTPESYKLNSQIQYQLAIHPDYGPGDHNIVKLTNPHPDGVGVNKNYMGVKFINALRIGSIDVQKTVAELDPFKINSQTTLEKFW